MIGFTLVIVYFGAALLAAAILLQSDWFTVTRSAVIDAPPDVAFRQINELRNWEAWSPWAKLDPHAQFAYSGPSAGVGASFEWSGDKRVGAGRMTIVESRPNESVSIKVEMRKPFAVSNDMSFMLEPEGVDPASAGRTKIVWSMSGRNTLVAKAMSLVVDRGKMVGGQFEQGLDNLNAVLGTRSIVGKR
jgi:hypothetical protein